MGSNRYIVHESANMKVCQYQVLTINGLLFGTNGQSIFLEYFTIN